VYLLAATCHVRGQDQEYYYRIARSIAREHTFAIEPLVFQNKELADSRGRDGLFYAQYAPGLPIALVPLVLAGDRMKELMSGFAANYFCFYKSEGDIGPRVVASYFNILISAITVGLLTLLVVQLGYPVSGIFYRPQSRGEYLRMGPGEDCIRRAVARSAFCSRKFTAASRNARTIGDGWMHACPRRFGQDHKHPGIAGVSVVA